MNDRRCTICHLAKPIDEFRVVNKGRSLRAMCIPCERNYYLERLEANRDKINEQRRLEYRSNPGKFRAKSKRYREGNLEKVRSYSRDYVRKNRDAIDAYRATRERTDEDILKSRKRSRDCLRRKSEFIDAMKSNPCSDCGRRYPTCCMDFDHRDGTAKIKNVGKLRFSPRSEIEAEIAKCDLVCANCHRIRTQIRAFVRATAEESRITIRRTGRPTVTEGREKLPTGEDS